MVWVTTFNMKVPVLVFFLTLSLQSIAAKKSYIEVVKEYLKNGCTQKKENLYLSADQRKKIESLSKTKLYGGLALRYITTCPKNKRTYHYVDSHIVRTQNETVVVTISDDKLESFIVSSFNEPPEYLAPKKWYQQFAGTSTEQVLKVRDQIDGLSGATLTVNASVRATNKILALHKVKTSKD